LNSPYFFYKMFQKYIGLDYFTYKLYDKFVILTADGVNYDKIAFFKNSFVLCDICGIFSSTKRKCNACSLKTFGEIFTSFGFCVYGNVCHKPQYFADAVKKAWEIINKYDQMESFNIKATSENFMDKDPFSGYILSSGNTEDIIAFPFPWDIHMCQICGPRINDLSCPKCKKITLLQYFSDRDFTTKDFFPGETHKMTKIKTPVHCIDYTVIVHQRILKLSGKKGEMRLACKAADFINYMDFLKTGQKITDTDAVKTLIDNYPVLTGK
jgi:hypothetical protein